MAIQSQPSRIPEPFAGSGTKNIIPATNATPSASQAASWASGFPPECSQPISAGGCPVPRNDVNGALNQLSQDFAFRQDGGVWEWSALADYDASRVVRGSDGKLYFSVQQSGPSVVAGAQDPTADNGTYWTAVPVDAAGLVHKSGNEVIDGIKFFTTAPRIKNAAPGIVFVDDDYTIGSSTCYYSISFRDSSDAVSADIVHSQASNEAGRPSMSFEILPQTADEFRVSLFKGSVNRVFSPYPDNELLLGTADSRWKQIYAGTATISTSDERQKTDISGVPDAVLDAWETVDFVQFRFCDAVAEKGSDARLHSGLIAQRIGEAFKARGLDASDYGLFCFDQWDEQEKQVDEKGRVLQAAMPAGDRYSLRYEEALCMEAACQRRRADRAEARIAALEERLAAIEAKLNA